MKNKKNKVIKISDAEWLEMMNKYDKKMQPHIRDSKAREAQAWKAGQMIVGNSQI